MMFVESSRYHVLRLARGCRRWCCVSKAWQRPLTLTNNLISEECRLFEQVHFTIYVLQTSKIRESTRSSTVNIVKRKNDYYFWFEFIALLIWDIQQSVNTWQRNEYFYRVILTMGYKRENNNYLRFIRHQDRFSPVLHSHRDLLEMFHRLAQYWSFKCQRSCLENKNIFSLMSLYF